MIEARASTRATDIAPTITELQAALWRLAGRSAIRSIMPKHPKLTTEPSTTPTRLTPQEIDELRESVHRMDAEMRAILGARKKQAEAQ